MMHHLVYITLQVVFALFKLKPYAQLLYEWRNVAPREVGVSDQLYLAPVPICRRRHHHRHQQLSTTSIVKAK